MMSGLILRRLLPGPIGSDILRKAFTAEKAHGGNEAVEVGDLPVTEDWTAEISADLPEIVRIASDEPVRLCRAAELAIDVEEQLATGIQNSGEMRPCSGDRLFRRELALVLLAVTVKTRGQAGATRNPASCRRGPR
jgi:hypothetical protein